MRPIRVTTDLATAVSLAAAMLCGSLLHAAESPARPILDLRQDQENYLRHYATTLNPPAVNEAVSVGAVIPSGTELHALPAAVSVEVPAGRTLRFVAGGGGIAIVDPRDRKVVQVLPPR
jgi:hypothetical protein